MGSDDEVEYGPFYLDYLDFMRSFPLVAFPLLFVWLFFLIHLLGNTAGNYLSPTLAILCDKLNLPYNVAGVTFLAFGNGAPDVFSLVASFTNEDVDSHIGVGALLGAGMFVTTVVVGTITVISPCKLHPAVFLRDTSFYLAAVAMLGMIVLLAQATLLTSILLFVAYGAYACFVVRGYVGGDVEGDKEEGRTERVDSVYTTEGDSSHVAFWSCNTERAENILATGTAKLNRERGRTASDLTSSTMKSKERGRTASDVTSITDTSVGSDTERKAGSKKGKSPALRSTSQARNVHGTERRVMSADGNYKFVFVKKDDDEEDDEESQAARAADTGAGLGFSAHTSIVDDYFRLSAAGHDLSGMDEEMMLRMNLLGDEAGVLDHFYWHQWMIRRRLQKHINNAEFWEYPWHHKVLAVIEAPWTFARDITIPTVDETLWYKPYAVLQPVCAGQLLLFAAGVYGDEDRALAVITIFLLSCFVAGGIHLFTLYSAPLQGKTAAIMWTLFGFIMCICWIYMLASELVTLLSAMGTIFEIPPGVLGLTVLAWGNSLGDLMANSAVAREGRGEMAIAGCYAGPAFNLLVGLGLSLTYRTAMSYPHPFHFDLDVHSTISLFFIVLSLILALVVVPLKGYKLDRFFGYMLYGLYGVYSLIQLAVLVWEEEKGKSG